MDNWQEDLRAASTEEELERILPRIPVWSNEETLRNITSPCVLHAFLRRIDLLRGCLRTFFYIVAKSCRIDLLEVFFSFLTLEDLEQDQTSYYLFVRNVIKEGIVDVIAFLLEKGMDPNMRRSLKSNPILYWACFYEKIDIVDLLLQKGADPNAEDEHGYTPIVPAMWSSDVRVLDRLIVYGANLFHRNEDGQNLWAAVPSDYTKEMEPNFRRLADMNVSLDQETYNKVREASEEYFEDEDLLELMREVMQKQGLEVQE